MAAEGFGVLGESLFASEVPADKSGLALRATGGGEGRSPLGDNRQTVQVIARFADYTSAHAAIYDVHDWLVGQQVPFLLNSLTPVHSCKAMQPPIDVGMDVNEHRVFACNFAFVLAIQ